MSAVLFGSIGALADTSEVQREAFNEAFRAHGLDWNWSREEYRQLLQSSGGKDRIAAYAQLRMEDVDAAAVHQTKSEIFQRRLQEGGISPRPGVVQTILAARRDGAQVALVTTTSPDNITALCEALRPQVDVEAFALVVDTTLVEHPKPAPDAYRYALAQLGELAAHCVAVEDNIGGVQAAVAAGVPCVAFPGENNTGHDFDQAARQAETLTFAELQTAMTDESGDR